jgi:hypothetical protein
VIVRHNVPEDGHIRLKHVVNVKTLWYICTVNCVDRNEVNVGFEVLTAMTINRIMLSSGTRCHAVWYKFTDVSDECTASIFKVNK